MTDAVTGVILAGGRSSRLGFDKTRLHMDGESLLARTVGVLHRLCSDVIVVVAEAGDDVAGCRCVTDIYAGKGVLGGIYTGLFHAATEYAVAVAADMPFLNAELLAYLVSLAPGYDVVVPQVNGYTEPLHAVYSRRCLPAMEQRLRQPTPARVVSFFADVRVRYVEAAELDVYDPGRLSLFNINTPDDLERARVLLRERGLDIAVKQ